jgi:APA family basic amino acid/polyamine antiporter
VRAIGYPWLPALYVIVNALLCLNLLIRRPLYSWPGLVVVALGVPIYYLWRSRAARAEGAA